MGVRGGPWEPESPPPWNLADQLTLFKPEGQIITLLPALPPRIQKDIYTSAMKLDIL